jgi:uncharacterized membrane protein
MRIAGLIAATSILLTACGERRDDPPVAAPVDKSATPAGPSDASTAGARVAQAGGNSAVAAAPSAPTPASPCLVQDGKPVPAAAVRAVGTEPFWNARVEGRCVTYSHPEDQKGTRVWTRFAAAPGGGTWTGRLSGRPFVLRIRPEPGCSDGMSDRRYPLAAELSVGGETRRGCAEPLKDL